MLAPDLLSEEESSLIWTEAMNGPVTKTEHLSVPAVEHQHFNTNFIRIAVCEARFPTLYDIDDPRPPKEFAHALRREYPVHNLGRRVTLDGTSQVDKTNAHVFTSRNSRWTVNLTASTLSLETSRYDSFLDFEKRIGFLIDACQTFIDSDFFTRLGIRYVNTLPYDRDRIGQWVNPLLVNALANGTYGDVTECGQAIRGTTEAGGFFFQHGIGKDSDKRAYALDFDFYAENVEISEAAGVIKDLHKRQFEMFIWSLGESAKEHLRTAS